MVMPQRMLSAVADTGTAGRLPRCAANALAIAMSALWFTVQACSASPLPRMSPTQYAAAVEHVRTAIEFDIHATGSSAPAALVPIVRCVVTAPTSSDLVTVDNRALTAEIAAAETAHGSARTEQLRVISDKLGLLQSEITGSSPSVTQTAQGVSAARAVLLSPQFASDAVPPPTVLQKWQTALSKWWDDLLRKLSFHPRGPSVRFPPVSGRLVVAVVLLIITIMLGILIYYFIGWLRTRTVSVKRPAGETSFAVTAQEAALVAARDFEKLMELARQRAGEGDFRSAFRLVYVASLVSLDTNGIVRLNRSYTNWEYLRSVGNGKYAYLYNILLPITRDFDRIWYGFQPAGRSDYDRAVGEYDRLRDAAANPPQAAASTAEPAAAT